MALGTVRSHPLKIVHIQRLPPTGANSIEKLFARIRLELVQQSIDVRAEIAPQLSQGLKNRFQNIQWAKQLKADVLHVTGDIHYVTLGLNKDRSILTIHDLEMLSRLKGWKRAIVKTFWFDLPIKKVRFVTCISKATESKLLATCRVDPKKVRVIPNLLPRAYTFQPKTELQPVPRILFLGTKHNKNLERVLQALKDVVCELVIVGKLSAKQTDALINSKIRYTNLVGISDDELEEQYRQSDLLCFPSLEEGFGLPIIEAQSMGRAVITSNVSSMPEVAGHGACLVDPLSVESIREAINRIIKDSSYRSALVQRGYENQKRFSPQQVASQYLDLYREVHNGP
jgi:glycosyltransferase involved in cell wall biosynthesis